MDRVALDRDASGAPVTPVIMTAAASAFPPLETQSRLWEDVFAHRFPASGAPRRIFEGVGVQRRHAVVNPRFEDVSRWSTGARMARFAVEAAPLAKDAVSSVLAAANLDAGAVGLLVVVSCTGYATPGLDIVVARDLGMSPSIQRLTVGHVGCHAALPALGAARDFVAVRGEPAVVLCVELPSLHLQPPGDDFAQLVPHALFGDAASAVVLEPFARSRSRASCASAAGARQRLEPEPLAIIDFVSRSDFATADYMTWDVTDHGFRMQLSRKVPTVLAAHVGAVVEDLLRRNDVARDDVEGWAVHPGGPQILDVVEAELRLVEGELDSAREVLASRGNCSSATVLIVLDALRSTRSLREGAYVVALAFGPGLTIWAALLRHI